MALQPDMPLELPSGADFWSKRRCKTNPVDLEGSRGQGLVVLGGFWRVLGEGWEGSTIKVPLWPKAGYEAPLSGTGRHG